VLRHIEKRVLFLYLTFRALLNGARRSVAR
jgi:hypothetical protein